MLCEMKLFRYNHGRGKFMCFIWLVCSILCLIYYIICVNYAGFGSAFVPMWLVASLAFLAIFIICILAKMNYILIPKFIKISFLGLVFTGIFIFLILEGLIISKMFSVPNGQCDCVIVLGAQIKGKNVSKALKQRLDTAYDYIQKSPNTKIIVSGGKGRGEEVTEAYAMKQYLIARGIDANQIIMEDQSFNTDQNMRFSMKYIDNKNASVGIVTSNFHVFRALKLAKAQGLTNLSGLASPCSSVLFINYMVRESVGIVKDAVMRNY